MYVNRLRLWGVKPLRCDIPADGAELPEPARRRLLLQGGNGSGKTVVLETIATLWKFWGEWVDVGDNKTPPRERISDIISRSRRARGDGDPWPCPSYAACVDRHGALLRAWDELKEAFPKHIFVGLTRAGSNGAPSYPMRARAAFESFRQRSLVGSEPQANVVYFPPEGRTIVAPKKASEPSF